VRPAWQSDVTHLLGMPAALLVGVPAALLLRVQAAPPDRSTSCFADRNISLTPGTNDRYNTPGATRTPAHGFEGGCSADWRQTPHSLKYGRTVRDGVSKSVYQQSRPHTRADQRNIGPSSALRTSGRKRICTPSINFQWWVSQSTKPVCPDRPPIALARDPLAPYASVCQFLSTGRFAGLPFLHSIPPSDPKTKQQPGPLSTLANAPSPSPVHHIQP
jgi:hypothetical protein